MLEQFAHDGMNRSYVFTRGQLSDALVVVLHAHGSTVERAYAEDALQMLLKGFSVLFPQGVGNSWNSGECCGEAKLLRVDDVGFVTRLTRFVLQKHFTAQYNNNNGGRGGDGHGGVKVYLTGYSNGAFLASKLALTPPPQKKNEWISAVAMRNGYSYDVHLYTDAKQRAASRGRGGGGGGMAVLALHGEQDDHVSAKGCCKSNTGCMHDLGAASEVCVPFQQAVAWWKQIKHCPTGSSTSAASNFGFSDVTAGSMSCDLLDKECGVTACLLHNQGHMYDLEDHTNGGNSQIETDFFWHDYSTRWSTRRIASTGVVVGNAPASSLRTGQQDDDDAINAWSSAVGLVVLAYLVVVGCTLLVQAVRGRPPRSTREEE